MDADKRVKTGIGNVRIGERNIEEARSLSPIEEESESMPFFRELPSNFAFSEPEESGCGNATRSLRKECRRIFRKIEEAEASGDNDEAEIGLRDKSLKTTVEQLKRRLSQAEREIVALRRYRSPRKCQSHERCEILRRDLLTWRDDHEKRIDSQVASWQLTEQKRIRDEMGSMRKVYDTIQRQLEALERQSTRSYADFRRQIDVWEKRFKEDVVSLHDSDLTELRKQLKAWCEMQNAINLSRVRREKCKARGSRLDDTAEMRDESPKSRESAVAMLPEDSAKFLRRIERVIKLEVQQQRDDLMKRMDQKIARLWSALEDFKHNLRLDRDYYRCDSFDTDNDDADSFKTGSLNDAGAVEKL